MWWLAVIALQIYFVIAGIRQEERAGLWSWSKFFFALGFGALESVIVVLPIFLVGIHSRYFWWACGTGWAIAAANFVWFILTCRRWKLPDGRTSLQAYREEQGKS
jgi:hypothetical protein